MDEISDAALAYDKLYKTIKILRAPGGCPWDREQTPLSMRRDLIEETFEAVDAITEEDATHAKEELGDVMLNTSLIAYMFEQDEKFSVASSINELTEKLIRRHPHVFPESEGKVAVKENVKDSASVLAQWDAIKETVEGRKTSSILDEVPKGFPPLLKSFKLQKKASKKGFDWDNLKDVITKVSEELDEVKEAFKNLESVQEKLKQTSAIEKSLVPFSVSATKELNDCQKALEGEVGDLLFAVVNYSRKLGVDPEVALNVTNQKFYNRFCYVEKKMEENNIPMQNGNLSQMDKFWNEAKEKERKQD